MLMKAKLLGTALALITTMLIVSGCGSSASSSTGSATAPSASNITIGFIPGVTTDPFFISMETGAQQEAQRLGVHLLWQGPTQYAPSAQTPVVNSLVARGVNALVVAPTDATAMIPPIRNAVNAHIPVVTVDSTITDTSLLTAQITASNTQGGSSAADILAQQVGEKGTVVVLAPGPGITTDAQRVQGFTKEIAKYPNIQYIGVQYDQEQDTRAASLAQELLLSHPNLVGIFGTDDTSASGAANGIRTAGKSGKVKIVAYDAEPQEVQGLQQGLISALIAQKPSEEGQLAVQAAYYAAARQLSKVTKSTQLDNIVIDMANLAQNEQWEYRTTP